MTWSVDLPNWQSIPDPEVAGSVIWCHLDYHGAVDFALALLEEGRPEVSILKNPLILPVDIDGECMGSYPDWDIALESTLAMLELQTD